MNTTSDPPPIFASYSWLIGLDNEAAFAALRMIVGHLSLVEGPLRVEKGRSRCCVAGLKTGHSPPEATMPDGLDE
jgi:hypothetical protein